MHTKTIEVKLDETIGDIREEFKETNKIPKAQLILSIKETLGSNPRTISKYLKLLFELEYIKIYRTPTGRIKKKFVELTDKIVWAGFEWKKGNEAFEWTKDVSKVERNKFIKENTRKRIEQAGREAEIKTKKDMEQAQERAERKFKESLMHPNDLLRLEAKREKEREWERKEQENNEWEAQNRISPDPDVDNNYSDDEACIDDNGIDLNKTGQDRFQHFQDRFKDRFQQQQKQFH